jgi:hypothetical protein
MIPRVAVGQLRLEVGNLVYTLVNISILNTYIPYKLTKHSQQEIIISQFPS